MKRVFCLVLFCTLACTSCVELAVGGAIAGTTAYVANQGVIKQYYNRNFESCWEITHGYLQEVEAEITYSSKAEGRIEANFKDKGSCTINVARMSAKATEVKMRAMRFGLPNNDLANTYYKGLYEKLQP